MDLELKYIVPLIGVLLGWILSTLTTFFKEYGENKRRLGKAIVNLNYFNQEKIKLIHHIDYLNNAAGLESDFEDLRKRAWDKYVFPEENYKTLIETVEDISGLYPMLGIKLKYLVESHMFSKKMKFDSTAATNLNIYIKLLSAFEATFELEQKELQKILFRLSFKYGFITWIKMKRKYNKGKKNVDSFKKTDFFSNLTNDISSHSETHEKDIISNDKAKNDAKNK